MSAAPFDVNLVIDRLKTQVTKLQQVRGVADYASVDKLSDFRTPEAFVVLARERGKPSQTGNNSGHAQQFVEVYFGVVIAVRNYREQRGKPALDAAGPLVGEIRQALLGWIPQDAAGVQVKGARGCQWIQGDVMDYDAGTLLWSDVFQTQHLIGNPRQ